MNWKEYKKLYKEIERKVGIDFAELKRNLLEELKEEKVSVLMDVSLTLQDQVPVEERRKVLKQDGGEKQ